MMIKNKIFIILTMTICLLCIGKSGFCANTGTMSFKASKGTIENNKITIEKGTTITIQGIFTPPQGVAGGVSVTPVDWDSSNNSVVECTAETEKIPPSQANPQGGTKATNKATIKALKSGIVTITYYYKMGASGYQTDQKSTFEVTVEDKEAKKEAAENQQNQKDEAEKNYKNAYKTALADTKNFSAEEVKQYIMSDYLYNSSKKAKNASKQYQEAKAEGDVINTALYRWSLALQERTDDQNIDTYRAYVVDLMAAENETERNAVVEEYFDQLDEIAGEIDQNFENWQNRIDALVVEGEDRNPVTFEDFLENPDGYETGDIDDRSANKIENATSQVLTVITNIGMILAVLMLAILGVKYMLGSVEEKADYKKDLIPYLVGACLLFGITAFMKIIVALGQSINNI